MTKYREDAEKATPSTGDEGPPILAASPREEAYTTLAAQYGLDDDMIIGNSGNYRQTVEEEYQAYVTAPTLSKAVDPLKFWEACRDINGA
jgi:hypothetical protein